jgi:hypothetical protein
MQLFNKNEGTFTPDALIVSPDFPILTGGIGLKRGQGVLKRGTVIVKGTDKNGYIAGTTVSSVTMKAFGILTDDVDTGSAAEGDNIPAVCYITGYFNRGAVAVKAGATIDTYEDELKGIGIHLANVQKYE